MNLETHAEGEEDLHRPLMEGEKGNFLQEYFHTAPKKISRLVGNLHKNILTSVNIDGFF